MSPLRPSSLAALLVAAWTVACSSAPPTDPRMVSEWMHTLYGVVRSERLTPPVASRFLAYASVALYEGLATTTPGLPPLAGLLTGLPAPPPVEAGRRYDPTLAAVAAVQALLDSMLVEGLPATRATIAGLVDSLRSGRIAAGVGDAVRLRSEELGQEIGLAVVAWARTDGFDDTRGRPYTPPVGPGLFVADAPGSTYAAQNLSGVSEFVALDNPTNALRPGSASDRGLIMNRPKRGDVAALPVADMTAATEPYWGRLRPFVLTAWNECPIPDPPPYATDPKSAFYQEAMEVYEAGQRLTPEHRAIALYWADNPGETATPAGHWLAIASQMVSQRRLSVADAARLFVVTAVAQADAFIAAWGYKYQFNLIRPRTYVRRVIDPAWEPLIPTPSFPEYPSGHSTQSAAAAAAITGLLGDTAFEDSTGLGIGHPVRRFGSLAEAAEEAGWSRIYGGIHFHFGKTGGKTVGACIGALIVERLRVAGGP